MLFNINSIYFILFNKLIILLKNPVSVIFYWDMFILFQCISMELPLNLLIKCVKITNLYSKYVDIDSISFYPSSVYHALTMSFCLGHPCISYYWYISMYTNENSQLERTLPLRTISQFCVLQNGPIDGRCLKQLLIFVWSNYLQFLSYKSVTTCNSSPINQQFLVRLTQTRSRTVS